MMHRLKAFLQQKVEHTEHLYLVCSIVFGWVGILKLCEAVQLWHLAADFPSVFEQDPTVAAISDQIADGWRDDAVFYAVTGLVWLAGSGMWALMYRGRRRRRLSAPGPDVNGAARGVHKPNSPD